MALDRPDAVISLAVLDIVRNRVLVRVAGGLVASLDPTGSISSSSSCRSGRRH